MSNTEGNCSLKEKKTQKTKNVQKGIAGPPYLLSPSPKPNLMIHCLLGEKLSTLKCKPQNLQQLISPCKIMGNAVCLIAGLAGRGWNEGWSTSPPSCWCFWANNFRKTYPPSCHWPGRPWKGSIMKEKGLLGMGHVPEKFCGMETGDFRV